MSCDEGAVMDVEVELVQLCMGTMVLKHSHVVGDYFAPTESDSTLELTFLKLHGPAVTVEAGGRGLYGYMADIYVPVSLSEGGPPHMVGHPL